MQRERYQDKRENDLKNIYGKRNERKKTIRQFLGDWYKEHPCVDCGESDLTVLEFDHLLEKNFGMNRAISNTISMERIVNELEQGEVRCANCHRKITAERTRNWRWRYKVGLPLDDLDYTVEY